MAVEIPVVIDIEGGFEDAAKRVPQAVEPLQRTLSEEALSIEIKLDSKGAKATVKQFVDGSIKDIKQFRSAISQIKREMQNMALSGNFDPLSGRGAALSEALLELTRTKEEAENAANKLLKNSRSDERLDAKLRAEQEHLKSIENTILGISEKIKAVQEVLDTTKIDSPEFEKVAARFREISAEMEAVQRKLAELGTKTGSIDNLNLKLGDLQKAWSAMPFSEMVDASGKLTKPAQNIQNEYTKVVNQLEKQRNLLNEQLEQQKKVAEEARKKAQAEEEAINALIREEEEMKKHQAALNMTARSMDDLNTKLAAWQVEMKSADIGSQKWYEAAQNVALLSQEIKDASDALAAMGLKVGSIDAVNAKIQQLNKEWNSMGLNEKYIAGDPSKGLTERARAVISMYKQQNDELQQQAISLEKIAQKEADRVRAINQGAQRRRYENAILSTTVKTMRVLQEQERILSGRLNKAVVGSSKYEQLKQQLKDVRVEIAKINQDMAGGINPAIEKTNSRLLTLLKNSARLVALHAAGRFVRNIREVTAEFELQRVALGGIIHDTEQANALFKQIKAAAIESPFEIKDLVSYTKQLSAYRVETENLFDVTMRLADVSAGLGVDMSRLILAYGQVRAASVLRGQELRQFTEAGIPLVELLADKFTKLRGEMVSTGEVFELISKRAVPFKMIEEIFNDMTDAGGMFYKMQEKQVETLAGQWANLKDAASIMYDEIGNTDFAHRAMEQLIGDAKNLMNNWRTVGRVIAYAGAQFLTMRVASLFMPTLTHNTKLAEKATSALARAEQLESAQQMRSNAVRGIAIKQLQRYAEQMKKAAAAQTLFGRGWHQLAASFLGGGWIGLAVTALTTVTALLVSAHEEANRLNKELQKIGTEGGLQINRSVSNFQRLAEAAVNAADGSKAQNEALSEMERTYGDIIPREKMQIEQLRAMKGSYDELTEAIKQKINMQIREQKIDTITDSYSRTIQKGRKNAKNLLLQYGLDKEQINAVMDEVERAVDEGMIGVETTLSKRVNIFAKIIKELTGITVDFGNGFRDFEGNWRTVNDTNNKAVKTLSKLADTYIGLGVDIEEVNNDMAKSIGTMGTYAESWENLQEELKEVSSEVDRTKFGDEFSFSFDKERVRLQVEKMSEYIREAFKDTDIDISEAFDPKGTINFKFLDEAARSTEKWGLTSFIKNVRKSYEEVVPTNQMVGVVERKFQEIAQTVGLSMDDIRGYLLRGETDMKDYAKEIDSSIEELKNKQIDYAKRAEDFAKHPYVVAPVSSEEVDKVNKLVEALSLISTWLSEYQTTTKKVPHETDPWITNMQERIKFMQDFKKGYDDLRKYLSQTAALGEEAGVMLGRGQSLGLTAADQSKAAENLSSWYEDMIKQTSERLRAKGVTGRTVTDLLGIDTTKKSKDIQDLQKLLQSLWDAKTDFDISEKKKSLEDAMRKLSDEIKQTETARNFFNDILNLTGDQELAASLSVSVYGGIGEEFKERMQDELNAAMESLDADSLTDDLRKAFAGQNFDEILKSLDKFPEEWQKRLKEMAADSQKFNADRAKEILKALENAKTYGDQMVEIAQQTARRTADIQAMNIPDSAKQKLLRQNAQKEAEQTAKIAYEAFKDTPMYVELFADLNAASGRMLRNMRQAIEGVKESWKDLPPKDIKELQSRLNELDEQIASRNPFAALIDSIKQYRSLMEVRGRAEADLAAITANQRMETEKAILDKKIEAYNVAVETYGVDSKEVQAAKLEMDVQAAITDDAIEQAEAAQNAANAYRESAGHIQEAVEKMREWSEYTNDALDGINAIFATFSSNKTADTFSAIVDSVKGAMQGAVNVADGVSDILTLHPVKGISKIISGIGQFISKIFGVGQMLKMNRLNDQIADQQDVLSNLEREYNRLQKAMESAFNSDYIYNYNQQLENLYAQQVAYAKQAELERQKGKKADEEKIEEYERSAEEAAEQIMDMQGKLAEHLAGTDVPSAAREFAKSWIEAHKSFASTTAAIREDFRAMIDNMITETLAGKVIQEILDPIFRDIENYAKDGELTESEIASLAEQTEIATAQIDSAMTALMQRLTAAGINMRGTNASLTGISRDIAGASEQSINGLAAGINTQNFYMSYMPSISENVAAIRAVIAGAETSPIVPAASAAQQQFGDELFRGQMNRLDVNIADIRSMLASVVTLPGANTNTKVIAVKV